MELARETTLRSRKEHDDDQDSHRILREREILQRERDRGRVQDVDRLFIESSHGEIQAAEAHYKDARPTMMESRGRLHSSSREAESRGYDVHGASRDRYGSRDARVSRGSSDSRGRSSGDGLKDGYNGHGGRGSSETFEGFRRYEDARDVRVEARSVDYGNDVDQNWQRNRTQEGFSRGSGRHGYSRGAEEEYYYSPEHHNHDGGKGYDSRGSRYDRDGAEHRVDREYHQSHYDRGGDSRSGFGRGQDSRAHDHRDRGYGGRQDFPDRYSQDLRFDHLASEGRSRGGADALRVDRRVPYYEEEFRRQQHPTRDERDGWGGREDERRSEQYQGRSIPRDMAGSPAIRRRERRGDSADGVVEEVRYMT